MSWEMRSSKNGERVDDHNYYNLIDSAAYYSFSIYSIIDELFLYHTKEAWENFELWAIKKWELLLQSFFCHF